MTDIDMEFDFDAVQGAEASKTAAAQSGGNGTFRRWEWLDTSIKGGPEAEATGSDRLHIRYLTDYARDAENGVLGWITTDLHNIVGTKPKPASLDQDASWPKALPAVCRKHKIFAAKFPEGCWVCDNKMGYGDFEKDKKNPARPRTFAVAVVRKPIYREGTSVIEGFEDDTIDLIQTGDDGKAIKDKNGNVVVEKAPRYVIVRQAWRNYFQSLDLIGRQYGTVLDRDFLVVRSGSKKDTTYDHLPMDPMNVDLGDGNVVRLDFRNKDLREAFYPDMPSLTAEIARLVGKDYWNQYFIPQADDDTAKGSSTAGAESSAPASASAAKEGDSDRMAAIKERLLKQKQS